MPDAALVTFVREQPFQGGFHSRVAIGSDQLDLVPLEATLFEINEEFGPVLL